MTNIIYNMLTIQSEDRMEWDEETMIDMVDGKRRGRPRLYGWWCERNYIAAFERT